MTGNVIGDILLVLMIIWGGGFIGMGILFYVEYRRDCKRYGKDKADEMWRRRR